MNNATKYACDVLPKSAETSLRIDLSKCVYILHNAAGGEYYTFANLHKFQKHE